MRAHHLVTATVGDRAELRVHPPVGVADPEVAVDELEALAEAVHQPLVELLERGGLAARPVQHHDDDREGAEEVEDHERGVHHHVRTCPGAAVDERGHHAVHAPQRERHRQEARSPVAQRLRPPGPELQPGHDEDSAGDGPHHAPRGHPHEAARGDGRVGEIADPGGGQRRQHADQHVPRPDPVVDAKGQAAGQHQERGDKEGGIDQRAQDIEVRNEGPRQVQPLAQAHEAPGQQQVVEEPGAVERIQVGEDQELQRQGERRRKRQRGGHGHGHNAPQVILPAYVNLHANVTPRVDWHRRTGHVPGRNRPFRCETTAGSVENVCRGVQGNPGDSATSSGNENGVTANARTSASVRMPSASAPARTA